MSSSGDPGPQQTADPSSPATVGQLMRPAAATVEAGAHLAAAAFLMKRSGHSALVVTKDDGSRAPVGVITDADISQAVADGRDMEQVRIRDVLSRHLASVTPDTAVDAGALLMLDRGTHHLLVVSDGRLVGIVDMADLYRSSMGLDPRVRGPAEPGTTSTPDAPAT